MKNKWRYLPGILCLFYYIVVCIITGRIGGTQLVWLFIAAYLTFLKWLRYRVRKNNCSRFDSETISATRSVDRSVKPTERAVNRDKLVLRICTVLLIMGLACGLIVEGMIFSAMVKEPEQTGEYVIVLGAKVNGTTPSWSLRYRIDSAEEYLKENPQCVAIASGGQGADEGISEALAIKNALVVKGIDPERIILEDRSTSTEENLEFSGAVIESCGGSKDSEVVIITSDFHMFRALRLAEKLGYTRAQGKTAKTLWVLIPQNHLREILAVSYYYVTGTI